MQHLVQKALRDKLVANPALVSFIVLDPKGAAKAAPFNTGQANMFAEGDVRPTYSPPYVVFRFVRQRQGIRRNEFIQTWHIQLHNRDRGYFEIDSHETEIFTSLHDQTIAVDPSCPLFCLNNGVLVVSSLHGYDPVFKTEFVSVIVEVHLMKRNAT